MRELTLEETANKSWEEVRHEAIDKKLNEMAKLINYIKEIAAPDKRNIKITMLDLEITQVCPLLVTADKVDNKGRQLICQPKIQAVNNYLFNHFCNGKFLDCCVYAMSCCD